jgi:hypothetical protein
LTCELIPRLVISQGFRAVVGADRARNRFVFRTTPSGSEQSPHHDAALVSWLHTVRVPTRSQDWHRATAVGTQQLPGQAGVTHAQPGTPAVGYHQLSKGSSTYTTRPAGSPSGGVPPAVERQLHLLTHREHPLYSDAKAANRNV